MTPQKLVDFLSHDWALLLPRLMIVWLVVICLVQAVDPDDLHDLLVWHLLVYAAHQAEEHLWPGGLRAYVNAVVFKSGRPDYPATPGTVAFINMGLVWLPIVLGMLPGFFWLGLVWMAVTLVNACVHIIAAIAARRSNPGLVTAIALLLPFSAWFFHRAFVLGLVTPASFAALIIAAAMLHAVAAVLLAAPYLTKNSGTAA